MPSYKLTGQKPLLCRDVHILGLHVRSTGNQLLPRAIHTIIEVTGRGVLITTIHGIHVLGCDRKDAVNFSQTVLGSFAWVHLVRKVSGKDITPLRQNMSPRGTWGDNLDRTYFFMTESWEVCLCQIVNNSCVHRARNVLHIEQDGGAGFSGAICSGYNWVVGYILNDQRLNLWGLEPKMRLIKHWFLEMNERLSAGHGHLMNWNAMNCEQNED